VAVRLYHSFGRPARLSVSTIWTAGRPSFRGDGTAFDRFCNDRDRVRSFESSRYVSSDVIGYEDLDEHGGWRSVPSTARFGFPHHDRVGAPYAMATGHDFALGLDLGR